MKSLLTQNSPATLVPRGIDPNTLDGLPIKPGDKADAFLNNTNFYGDKAESIKNTIVSYVGIALVLADYVLILAIIYSGIKYIIAGGDEGKLESAKKNLYWSIIGFIIVNGALAIYTLFKEKIQPVIPDARSINSSNLMKITTDFVADAIGIILATTGVVFLIMLLINSFRYLVSAGGDGTETAKKGLINAIIGIVIVALSYSIMLGIKKYLSI